MITLDICETSSKNKIIKMKIKTLTEMIAIIYQYR